jgi:hypothetical protein
VCKYCSPGLAPSPGFLTCNPCAAGTFSLTGQACTACPA